MSGMHRMQFDLESMFGSYFTLILIIYVLIFYHVKHNAWHSVGARVVCPSIDLTHTPSLQSVQVNRHLNRTALKVLL